MPSALTGIDPGLLTFGTGQQATPPPGERRPCQASVRTLRCRRSVQASHFAESAEARAVAERRALRGLRAGVPAARAGPPGGCIAVRLLASVSARRRWQESKRQHDEDYRANQARAQRVWAADHRDYWRAWRAAHPEYTERNRVARSAGATTRGRRHVCKGMDASPPISPVASGTYRLVPWTGGDLAKKDAWTVELTVISTRYATTGDAGAILQREDVMGTGAPPC